MLNYILGIITGILLTLPAMIAGLYLKPRIERFVNQSASKIARKGSLIEPNEEVEELNEWVNNLKEK